MTDDGGDTVVLTDRPAVVLVPAAVTVGELRRVLLGYADDAEVAVALPDGTGGRVERVRRWLEVPLSGGSRHFPELVVKGAGAFEVPRQVSPQGEMPSGAPAAE